MGKTGRAVGAAGIFAAGICVRYGVGHETEPRRSPAAITSVGMPVVFAHSTLPIVATPLPSPYLSGASHPRAEGATVQRVARRDWPGGDARVRADALDRQPHPSDTAPVETAMTVAVARLPVFAAAANPVHVNCVRTAREVAALLPVGQDAMTMAIGFRDMELERKMLAGGYTPGPVMVADAGNGHGGFVFHLNNAL